MYEHLLCSAAISGLKFLKFKVMEKLQHPHGPSRDESAVSASAASRFVLHKKLFRSILFPFWGISSLLSLFGPTGKIQEVVVKSQISIEN